MRDRMLSGEDGGVGRLRGNARGEHVFTEHALAGQRVDIRAGGERIPIAPQVIGAQGIRADQNNIRFCLHKSVDRRCQLTRCSPVPEASSHNGFIFRPKRRRGRLKRNRGMFGTNCVQLRVFLGFLLHSFYPPSFLR